MAEEHWVGEISEEGDHRRVAEGAAMTRLLKSVVTLSMLSVWGALSSCTFDPGSHTHLQREVERLQKLTIPPDSQLLDQHTPSIQGWVARADWEFQTNYSADAYNSWLAEEPRPDFHADGSRASPTRYSKYEQGDVETLSFVTPPVSGMLRVTVKLDIYPD